MKLQFSSLKAFKAFLATQALGNNPTFTGNVNGWSESETSQAYSEVLAHIAHYKKLAAKRAHRVTSISIRVSDYEATPRSDLFRLDVVLDMKPKF